MANHIAWAALAALFLLPSPSVQAQGPADRPITEPNGGQPPLNAKPSVRNLEEQVIYQRAFEAVIWSQPAVAIYGFRRGMLEGLGMKDNEVLAMSRPFTTRHEFLTANNTTPYIAANADLRHGPVVVEIPAASEKGVLYGQVVDAWQDAVADVGPSGEDKGNGGKYLFLPPGYSEKPPEGYFVVASKSYRIAFGFRSNQATRDERLGCERLCQDPKDVSPCRGGHPQADSLCRCYRPPRLDAALL